MKYTAKLRNNNIVEIEIDLLSNQLDCTIKLNGIMLRSLYEKETALLNAVNLIKDRYGSEVAELG